MAHNYRLSIRWCGVKLLALAILEASSSRPVSRNIIFFHCDEMDGRIVDPEHQLSRVAHLPNLEAMAKNGANFVRMYTNTPLCAPSRASMFTGRRTSSIEAWSNVNALAADVSEWPPTKADASCASFTAGYGEDECLEIGRRQQIKTTMNHAMAKLGYTVALYGKMDTGGGPSMTPPKTFAKGFHEGDNWTTTPMLKGYFYPGTVLHSWAQGANISKPQFTPLDAGVWARIDTEHAVSTEKQDWGATNNCVKFLNDFKEGDKPFFLYCSVENPHPPYTSNATWEAAIDRDELQASVDATARTYTDAVNRHPADIYSSLSERVPQEWNETLAQRLALAYHGATAEVDYMLGQVTKALENSPAANNTYVIFTSDHGEMHLEHRLLEKMSMYEGSARVPLLITGPDLKMRGTVKDFATLIDLLPTMLDMAGASQLPDAGLEGYSLAPLVGIPQARVADASPRPDFALVEYMGEKVNTPHFMIRTGDMKYIVYGTEPPYHTYAPRLFNVTADPYELNDLAAATSSASILQELDAKLRSVIDYPAVSKTLVVQQRRWTRRWLSANPGNLWKERLQTAYDGLDDEDVACFWRWLSEQGEYAPVVEPTSGPTAILFA